MIVDGSGFQLVPWQPVLGKRVGGAARNVGSTEWSFGRHRGLDLSLLPRSYEGPRQHHLLVAMGRDRCHPVKARLSRAPAPRLAALS